MTIVEDASRINLAALDLPEEELLIPLAGSSCLVGRVRRPEHAVDLGTRFECEPRKQDTAATGPELLSERTPRLNGNCLDHGQRQRSAWEVRYQLLLAYKDEFGDVLLPRSVEFEGVRLGAWLGRQRRSYQAGELSPERTTLLEQAGISWENRNPSWDEKLSILRKYVSEHGDANAPDGYTYQGIELGTWLQNQRHAYRNKTISSHRIEALEALGMVWSIREASWERHISLVESYKAKHWTANVPRSFIVGDVKLGIWIQNQRIAYKNGTLLPERQRRLETIGVRL